LLFFATIHWKKKYTQTQTQTQIQIHIQIQNKHGQRRYIFVYHHFSGVGRQFIYLFRRGYISIKMHSFDGGWQQILCARSREIAGRRGFDGTGGQQMQRFSPVCRDDVSRQRSRVAIGAEFQTRENDGNFADERVDGVQRKQGGEIGVLFESGEERRGPNDRRTHLDVCGDS